MAAWTQGETAGVRRPPGGQEAVASGAESGNGGRTYPGREEREHAWPGRAATEEPGRPSHPPEPATAGPPLWDVRGTQALRTVTERPKYGTAPASPARQGKSEPVALERGRAQPRASAGRG